MSDESNPMPASQVVRWVAAGVLILFAIALYLRDGRRLPPLRATPEAADTVAPR